MIKSVGIVSVVLLAVALAAVIVVPVVLLIGLLCSSRRTSAEDRVVLFREFAEAIQQVVSSISRRTPRSGGRD